MNTTYQKELITPSIASSLLELNTSNRRPKNPIVSRYAKDMLNGLWKTNTAEFIKISKTNKILDGQHRLMAVVKSGVSTYFDVARGLDDDIFDVLDTGTRRNASDVFKISGIKNEHAIPSIISHYNRYKSNNFSNGQVDQKLNNTELLNEYHSNEVYWQDVARHTLSWYSTFAKILQPSIIGGFYAAFHDVDPSLAFSFFNELATGLDVTNRTINLLRNKLMQDKVSPRKMQHSLKCALIIKTWNYYIIGKELTILKFDTVRDDFPTINTINNG
jgi:hypothetical protein